MHSKLRLSSTIASSDISSSSRQFVSSPWRRSRITAAASLTDTIGVRNESSAYGMCETPSAHLIPRSSRDTPRSAAELWMCAPAPFRFDDDDEDDRREEFIHDGPRTAPRAPKKAVRSPHHAVDCHNAVVAERVNLFNDAEDDEYPPSPPHQVNTLYHDEEQVRDALAEMSLQASNSACIDVDRRRERPLSQSADVWKACRALHDGRRRRRSRSTECEDGATLGRRTVSASASAAIDCPATSLADKLNHAHVQQSPDRFLQDRQRRRLEW